MSNIAHVRVSKHEAGLGSPVMTPEHSERTASAQLAHIEHTESTQRAQLAAGALRIPVWDHLEDRPGKDRDFQSDSCHAPE